MEKIYTENYQEHLKLWSWSKGTKTGNVIGCKRLPWSNDVIENASRLYDAGGWHFAVCAFVAFAAKWSKITWIYSGRRTGGNSAARNRTSTWNQFRQARCNRFSDSLCFSRHGIQTFLWPPTSKSAFQLSFQERAKRRFVLYVDLQFNISSVCK